MTTLKINVVILVFIVIVFMLNKKFLIYSCAISVSIAFFFPQVCDSRLLNRI